MHKDGTLLTALALLAGSAFAASPILGEVELEPASRNERDAGVWLDGQYVGFVKDLSGSGRLVLVPGQHELLVRLIGYEDVLRTIAVEPGERTKLAVAMQAATDVTYPDKERTARLRLSVQPEEAAIFVDDAYVGHVDLFDGRRGMRIAPGTYRFTIALPGYEAFETELTLRASQTYEIKTELRKGRLDEQASGLSARTDAGAAAR